MKKTEAELKECLKEAWSIENMEAHGAADRTLEDIGTIPTAFGKFVRLFEDSAGEYWYQTLYGTKDGVVTEYEAVFGHRKRA